MMPRKTVILSINASWNIVNFRQGLVRGLQAAGYDVVALTPADAYAPRLAAMGIRHYPVSIDRRGTSPVSDLALLRQYWRLLGEIRPDAYLGYTIKPNVWGSIAAHLRGIPTINNIAGLGETFIGGGAMNKLVRFLYARALGRSATIFFQNPDDRALFERAGIVAPAKVRLLPGSGVDLRHFSPQPRPLAAVDAPFRFLLVARLLSAKGIAEYVEAGRLVRTRHPRARLQLLGLAQDGRGAIDPAELVRWSAAGDVERLEPAEDVRPCLAAADAVVLPTYYPEGTPRSLLEAAAMARPIIASDTPGCREIVDDGVNGFLVPPRDAAALAETMLKLMEMSPNERETMGQAGRAKAERAFDEQLVIDQYLEALAKLTR